MGVEKKNNINEMGKVSIIEPNSVRIGIKSGVIQIEFGQNEDAEEHEERFTASSRVRLNPKYLKPFIIKMLEAGMEYEKTFKTDIGFTSFWNAYKD